MKVLPGSLICTHDRVYTEGVARLNISIAFHQGGSDNVLSIFKCGNILPVTVYGRVCSSKSELTGNWDVLSENYRQ